MGLLAIACLAGLFARLNQISGQVLIDDEWHVVHQVLRHSPAEMFFDFGYADYSIPIGMLTSVEAKWLGLSETLLRLPMIISGLAVLLAFPAYIARHLSYRVAAVFALLMAMSPLLVIFSGMARPYAITLLLGWVAHVAFRFYFEPRRRPSVAGITYVASTALACWLHLIIAPFVLAPLLWKFFELLRSNESNRREQGRRLVLLGAATVLVTASLLMPPLLANPNALTAKEHTGTPDLATLYGAFFAWFGTSSTVAVAVCLSLAAYGMIELWNRLPEIRSGLFGILLTLVSIIVARPAYSQFAVTFARYMLPILPLLLLATSLGAVNLVKGLAQSFALPKWVAVVATLLPCLALAWKSPTFDLLRRPNSYTLHLVNYADFRPEKSLYLSYMAEIPLSRFWSQLAGEPRNTIRIAAAPFYFESYNWDAPRWERISGQVVIPGYLAGLCVERRFGEVPDNPSFRFRNAVHLADRAALAEHHIAYIAWQKPYLRTINGSPQLIGGDTARCEATLRDKFGPPAFEDPTMVLFRLPQTTTAER